jgi:pimeloyl-ACP methyl ester carboxylesterase
VWRNVIPRLNGRFPCVAPDLLGLGDTETPEGTDWTLPTQLDMVLGLLDRLRLDKVALVGHDQGGAIAQLLATAHPARMSALVLPDAEAYHNWPSAEEIPFIHATQVPVVGRLLLWAWSRRRMFRWALAQGQAVHDRATLTDELVDGYIAANLATAYKRARTRRFLRAQLDHRQPDPDPQPHRRTASTRRPDVDPLGDRDMHFPPSWTKRLAADIPGTAQVETLPDAGHLLMEEHPDRVADPFSEFLTTTTSRRFITHDR